MSGWSGPEDRGEGEGLPALRALIVEAHPELAGSEFRLLAMGWDCVGVDVDDRLVFKVPREAEAAVALAREARLLAAVRLAVGMAVPDLQLFDAPRVHSRHPKIAGAHLMPPDYAALPALARERLAADLARFFADLHAIPLAVMRDAGAEPLEPWLPPDEIARRALPLLPDGLRNAAEAILAAFAALGPDPHGDVFGHFDAHGWNMAWDHAGQGLNGVYDFGDAGIGPLHGEFVAPALVSPDLAARIIPAYERMTGLVLDRERVRVLAGADRLWHLAEEADDPASFTIRQAAEWLAAGRDVLTTPA